jgi:hypothetical protein
MNAVWPNDRIPELPEKICRPTTSTTSMKKKTIVSFENRIVCRVVPPAQRLP